MKSRSLQFIIETEILKYAYKNELGDFIGLFNSQMYVPILDCLSAWSKRLHSYLWVAGRIYFSERLSAVSVRAKPHNGYVNESSA